MVLRFLWDWKMKLIPFWHRQCVASRFFFSITYSIEREWQPKCKRLMDLTASSSLGRKRQQKKVDADDADGIINDNNISDGHFSSHLAQSQQVVKIFKTRFMILFSTFFSLMLDFLVCLHFFSVWRRPRFAFDLTRVIIHSSNVQTRWLLFVISSFEIIFWPEKKTKSTIFKCYF